MFTELGPRAWVSATTLALGTAVVACGEGGMADSGAAPSTAQGTFPVTIEHRYGSTEIPAPPERIVTVGLTDRDTVLALGVTPVALIGEDGTYYPHGAQAQIDGLRSHSVYQAQPVVAQRRDVFLPPDGALGAALVYNNVLSLPFAIEGMMPLLQAAVDGDPNTAVSAA